LLQGFKDAGEVWIVMNMTEGWPESAFVDEESAEEAVRQMQDQNPDEFFKIVFSDMNKFVDIGDVEEDDWL
jgi:hypothetical protein